jgi:hypothetical protein
LLLWVGLEIPVFLGCGLECWFCVRFCCKPSESYVLVTQFSHMVHDEFAICWITPFSEHVCVKTNTVPHLGEHRSKCFELLLFFSSTGVWTQGLLPAGQVLYHLSQGPSPFPFSYFSDRVKCFFPEPALDCDSSVSSFCIASITGVHPL